MNGNGCDASSESGVSTGETIESKVEEAWSRSSRVNCSQSTSLIPCSARRGRMISL